MKGRRKQLRKQSVKAISELPEAPKWLSPEGKKYWYSEGESLILKGVLTTDDLPLFSTLARAYGEIVELEKILQKDGRIIEIRDKPQVHPAVRMLATAMSAFRQCCVEFGLTPKSRMSVDGGTSADDGDFS